MTGKKVFLIPCCEYSDINPVDSGYQICPANFKYGPGARNYTILHYVVKGKGIIRKNGIQKEVSASQCFIIRSEEVAYYKSDANEPWTYIWLGFRTALELPKQIAENDVIDAHKYKDVFMSILNHSDSEPELSLFLCSKCWELFSLMTMEDDFSSNTDVLHKARIYIENEYMNDINVAEIAAMLFVDRTVLSKSFKKLFGVSPQEYTCSYRLKKSLEFMKSGQYTLTQIATMCGYKDYSNFSRMFSRRYNMSPREYISAYRSK